MPITLDRQVVEQACPACHETFTVVRGSAYEEGVPIGLYVLALHGHPADGPGAHLAIGIVDRIDHGRSASFAMKVRATADHFGFTLIDWSDSLLDGEAYFQPRLNRDDALSSEFKAIAFDIANRVVSEVPEAAQYFRSDR